MRVPGSSNVVIEKDESGEDPETDDKSYYIIDDVVDCSNPEALKLMLQSVDHLLVKHLRK